jgi:hypothetical protein
MYSEFHFLLIKVYNILKYPVDDTAKYKLHKWKSARKATGMSLIMFHHLGKIIHNNYKQYYCTETEIRYI